MADQKGSSAPKRKRSKRLTYFYLNGNLHKSLHINRGADTVTTWCYPLHKRVAYTYSDVKIHHKPAFTTQEVCRLLNRSRVTLELAMLAGCFSTPQHTYGIDEHKRKYQYLWSEDNVLEAHAYLCTVHRGRPRKDGMIKPQNLPTAKELRAMMRNEEILYVRGDDGEFRPVWRAENFD